MWAKMPGRAFIKEGNKLEYKVFEDGLILHLAGNTSGGRKLLPVPDL